MPATGDAAKRDGSDGRAAPAGCRAQRHSGEVMEKAHHDATDQLQIGGTPRRRQRSTSRLASSRRRAPARRRRAATRSAARCSFAPQRLADIERCADHSWRAGRAGEREADQRARIEPLQMRRRVRRAPRRRPPPGRGRRARQRASSARDRARRSVASAIASQVVDRRARAAISERPRHSNDPAACTRQPQARRRWPTLSTSNSQSVRTGRAAALQRPGAIEQRVAQGEQRGVARAQAARRLVPTASSASSRRQRSRPMPRSHKSRTSRSRWVDAANAFTPRQAGSVKLGSAGSVDVEVALPALVLELERLDRDGVGVGVEIGQRLEFRHPAAEHLVGDRQLAGLVVDLDDDVLAEVLQRHLGAEPGAEVPDLVGPALELGVVRDAALQRDRLVLGAAGRLARRSRDRRLRGARPPRCCA